MATNAPKGATFRVKIYALTPAGGTVSQVQREGLEQGTEEEPAAVKVELDTVKTVDDVPIIFTS